MYQASQQASAKANLVRLGIDNNVHRAEGAHVHPSCHAACQQSTAQDHRSWLPSVLCFKARARSPRAFALLPSWKAVSIFALNANARLRWSCRMAALQSQHQKPSVRCMHHTCCSPREHQAHSCRPTRHAHCCIPWKGAFQASSSHSKQRRLHAPET